MTLSNHLAITLHVKVMWDDQRPTGDQPAPAAAVHEHRGPGNPGTESREECFGYSQFFASGFQEETDFRSKRLAAKQSDILAERCWVERRDLAY